MTLRREFAACPELPGKQRPRCERATAVADNRQSSISSVVLGHDSQREGCDDLVGGAGGRQTAAHERDLGGAPADGRDGRFTDGDLDLGAMTGGDLVLHPAECEVWPKR